MILNAYNITLIHVIISQDKILRCKYFKLIDEKKKLKKLNNLPKATQLTREDAGGTVQKSQFI